jgi:hypothetical protein
VSPGHNEACPSVRETVCQRKHRRTWITALSFPFFTFSPFFSPPPPRPPRPAPGQPLARSLAHARA